LLNFVRVFAEKYLNKQVQMRKLIIKLGLVLVVLFFVVLVLGLTIREPIESIATVAVARYGRLGLFLAVMCVDTIPGLTNEPLLLLASSGGLGFMSILVAAGLGSVMGGVVGWFLGGHLRKFRPLRERITRYGIEGYFQQYGGRTIAIAAVLPIPFALTTWAAGASGVDLRTLLLGAVWRIPKTGFYLTLIHYGWQVGA
jgi:membrane protein YqaA with SNARE-associated domain